MAGIYIHVPFCNRRCHYCDFYSSVNTTIIPQFIEALLLEIEVQRNFFSQNKIFGVTIDTIYFGGGTPSLLALPELEKILNKLHRVFNVKTNAEITIEANPDDLDITFIKSLYAMGFNRMSLGIQSFDNNMLKLMNRRHTAEQSIQSIENAIQHGFSNLSIDLIYGLPQMGINRWVQNIKTALSYPVTHISAYHLGIEQGTVFDHWHKKGKIALPSDNDSYMQFEILHNMCTENDFEHYEISNLAKPGFRSQHNTAYWQSKPYLGLGPAAHSYNGEQRFWNICDVIKYIELLNQNKAFYESEILTFENRLTEYIMTGLRTSEGIDLNYVAQNFGVEVSNKIILQLRVCEQNGHIVFKNNTALLTLGGWFVSDAIIAALI